MNVIGERLTVLKSADPTKVGRSGTVVLDTARTLVVRVPCGAIRVEKAGSVFQVGGAVRTVSGSELYGRLEDRWGRQA